MGRAVEPESGVAKVHNISTLVDGLSRGSQLSGDEFKGRAFCIVRSWSSLDVMVPDDMAIQIEAQR